MLEARTHKATSPPRRAWAKGGSIPGVGNPGLGCETATAHDPIELKALLHKEACWNSRNL